MVTISFSALRLRGSHTLLSFQAADIFGCLYSSSKWLPAVFSPSGVLLPDMLLRRLIGRICFLNRLQFGALTASLLLQRWNNNNPPTCLHCSHSRWCGTIKVLYAPNMKKVLSLWNIFNVLVFAAFVNLVKHSYCFSLCFLISLLQLQPRHQLVLM